MPEFATIRTTMSPEAFAMLGTRRIAYIRAVRSDEVAFRYPGMPQPERCAQLFALHAADGTTVMLAGTRESAMTGAISRALEIVSLH